MPIYETWHFSALVELGSEEQGPVTFLLMIQCVSFRF